MMGHRSKRFKLYSETKKHVALKGRADASYPGRGGLPLVNASNLAATIPSF